MTSLPTPLECLQMLKDQGCSREVMQHCLAVRDVAVTIATLASADVTLVECGALLHDLGRCKTHGITHGIVGAQLAQDLQLPKVIVDIIETHLGAGIPREEAKQLGLPEKDYLPITLEQKIVTHADNLIDKGMFQPIAHEMKRASKNHQDTLAQRMLALHKELSQICGVDLDSIEELVQKHKKERQYSLDQNL